MLSRLEVEFIAHPSFVDEGDLQSVSGPLNMPVAAIGRLFQSSGRELTEEIISNGLSGNKRLLGRSICTIISTTALWSDAVQGIKANYLQWCQQADGQ
jgi:hypothetical protein